MKMDLKVESGQCFYVSEKKGFNSRRSREDIKFQPMQDSSFAGRSNFIKWFLYAHSSHRRKGQPLKLIMLFLSRERDVANLPCAERSAHAGDNIHT